MKQGCKSIAIRQINAKDSFLELVISRGFTPGEAKKIFEVYYNVGAVKIDPVLGSYTLTHGRFYDREVMERALNY